MLISLNACVRQESISLAILAVSVMLDIYFYFFFYKVCPNLFGSRDLQGQSLRLAELVALALSSTLLSRNSCSMAKFRVEYLTYAHSCALPVPSLTYYGLPPTVIIPARRLINIKRPSCLEPRTFLSGARALATRTPAF